MSNMTESNARTVLTIAGTTATVCYILAIFFGLRGDSALSLGLFIFAILDSAVAYFAYLQYNRIRRERWNNELQESEQKMKDLMSSEGTEPSKD